MEELDRSLSNDGLTLSILSDKGRSLFTSRDFSPGEVIISEEPYVSVPNKNSTDSTPKCDWCFTSDNLKRCSTCKFVYYCSSACQKADWKLHKEECKVLLRVDKERVKLLTPTIRLMVKLCLRRKLQNEKIIIASAMDNYNLVKALVSHMSDIDEKQLVLYAQMANLVNLILRWPDNEIDLKEIAGTFAKFACNAHTICDSELRPLATGLYPVISIINHSCLPNAVLIFEGRLAVVRAVQHISKGTEDEVWPMSFVNFVARCVSKWTLPGVTISYIETAGSTLTRQKSLREQYFFSCTCPRCNKEDQVDDIQESAILEGYRCKDDKCDGFLLRDSGNKGFVCQLCGLLRDSEEIRTIVTEVKSISENASKSLSSGYHNDAASFYKLIEKLQVKVCHPFSINLMRTRESLLKIFMELQDWKEALAYCRLIIPVYQRIYPRFHPLLGLQYYTCGKLEWWAGETEKAIKSLTNAVDILRITHGANTKFVKELMAKLEEARAEESYKLSSGKDEE